MEDQGDCSWTYTNQDEVPSVPPRQLERGSRSRRDLSRGTVTHSATRPNLNMPRAASTANLAAEEEIDVRMALRVHLLPADARNHVGLLVSLDRRAPSAGRTYSFRCAYTWLLGPNTPLRASAHRILRS